MAFQTDSFDGFDSGDAQTVVASGGGDWGGRRFNTREDEERIKALQAWLKEQHEKDYAKHNPVEIVKEVARRQVETLGLDEHQRFEELERELEAREIEWDVKYLDLLNLERSKYLDAEIKRLIQIQRDEDEAMLVILIAANLT